MTKTIVLCMFAAAFSVSGCASRRYHIPVELRTPQQVFYQNDTDLIDALPRVQAEFIVEEIVVDPFLTVE